MWNCSYDDCDCLIFFPIDIRRYIKLTEEIKEEIKEEQPVKEEVVEETVEETVKE